LPESPIGPFFVNTLSRLCPFFSFLILVVFPPPLRIFRRTTGRGVVRLVTERQFFLPFPSCFSLCESPVPVFSLFPWPYFLILPVAEGLLAWGRCQFEPGWGTRCTVFLFSMALVSSLVSPSFCRLFLKFSSFYEIRVALKFRVVSFGIVKGFFSFSYFPIVPYFPLLPGDSSWFFDGLFDEVGVFFYFF